MLFNKVTQSWKQSVTKSQISHLHTSAMSVSFSCYELYMSIMMLKWELCFTEVRRVWSSLEICGLREKHCLSVFCQFFRSISWHSAGLPRKASGTQLSLFLSFSLRLWLKAKLKLWSAGQRTDLPALARLRCRMAAGWCGSQRKYRSMSWFTYAVKTGMFRFHMFPCWSGKVWWFMSHGSIYRRH